MMAVRNQVILTLLNNHLSELLEAMRSTRRTEPKPQMNSTHSGRESWLASVMSILLSTLQHPSQHWFQQMLWHFISSTLPRIQQTRYMKADYVIAGSGLCKLCSRTFLGMKGSGGQFFQEHY